MISMIQTILGGLSILFGIFILCVSTYGIFKFDYVLNRMHVAAKCDTMGTFFVSLGLMIYSGFTVTSLKILLYICLLWLTSPVSSHLIVNTEILTNPNAPKEMKAIAK